MIRWVLILGPLALICALPAALLGVVALSVGLIGAEAAELCGPGGPAQQVEGVELSEEQWANAEVIVSTIRTLTEGRDGGNPAVELALAQRVRAAEVAIVTAQVESNLLNLDYGDRDSLGLFQQREDLYTAPIATDPVRATTAFLLGTRAPNGGEVPGLVDVPGWPVMQLGLASVTVQRPAEELRHRYYLLDGMAQSVVAKLWPGAVFCQLDGATDEEAGGGSAPPGFVLPSDAQRARVVRFALAQVGLPYEWGAEGPYSYDCSGLMMAAWGTAGVALPRTTTGQVEVGGWITDLAYMEPGDLIFTPGSMGSMEAPRHVGMYIGRGADGVQYLVQAPRTGDVVKVTPVSDWKRIAMIRRPLLPE